MRAPLIFSILYIINDVRCCQEQNGCSYDQSSALLTCRTYIDDVYNDVRYLHLCQYNNATLHLSDVVSKVPLVESITITTSNFSYLVGPKLANTIENLRITNTTLRRIPDNLFVNMPELKRLDLRNNSMDYLPKDLSRCSSLESVYLSGNMWNCSLDLDWALSLQPALTKDLVELRCAGERYPDKPVVAIAQFKKNSQIDCPSPCTCSIPNVVRDIDSDLLHPIVEVNCSRRGLAELPKTLPNYARILLLESNSISDLSPLVISRIYRNVTDVQLDYNEVVTIANLEGSYWLAHFRLLSLRGNKLKQLPTHALDHALEQNPNLPDAVRLRLGENPWRCDCIFAPRFQQILMKYAHQIIDVSNVKCSYVEGDINSKVPILNLDRSSVCQPPSEQSMKALDILNIVLASLIVAILGKLGYDYYFFKKTGRLPWIVTKIP